MPSVAIQTDGLMEQWIELMESTDQQEKKDIMKFVENHKNDEFEREQVRLMYLNYVKMTKFFKTQLEKESISTDETSISTDGTSTD